MKEVDPMTTDRAVSWQMYRNAPMPMVTIFKTLDITGLIAKASEGYKLNMLMCYCIALASVKTPEFMLLPVGDKMISYERIGVNVIVANTKGSINSCDIPYEPDLDKFSRSYSVLTEKVRLGCENYEMEDAMIVGTSSLVKYDIDGVANMYSGIFNNPFVIWGKYKNEDGKYSLKISFQFHHVQMDGLGACEFLEKLQNEIFELSGR